tara:strand:+ start:103 stop:519 length:417 start_codon:yes stop_codon:yes gene_type:complete
MELDLILERLRLATGQKSDRAMCLYLGLGQGMAGNWKDRGTIPYQACFLAAQKSCYHAEWILTGTGPQKKGDALPPEIDEVKLQKDFLDTVNNAVEMGILNPTKDTTPEAMKMLAKMMYRKVTGSQLITEIKDSTLSA